MFAVATPFLRTADPDLEEARESLAYWETRLQRLPRLALRRRREARLMAARWRQRVLEAERGRYGSGALGALVMFVAERRLPVRARRTGRRVARVALGVTAAVAALATVLVVAVGVAAVEILAAVLHAL
jgi:hypothetical protein